MARKKDINFALLGLGKLGLGFYKLWAAKKDEILKKTGFNLNLKKILVKHINFERPDFVDQSLITDDLKEIVNDPEIKIAIDAIGGIEPTFKIIKEIISSKIHLISANRMLLAARMHEIADLANKNHIYIQPEPSLGGGVPIISAIQRDLLANNVKALYGILSGTSNLILTKMTDERISLQEALKSREILQQGESLSIVDYEGSDAAQKVSILAAAAFGIDLNYLQVYAEGIAEITEFDIKCADDFGYVFKFLAIIRDHGDRFEVRVHPTLVPKNHPLALVRGEYNAYLIETDLLDDFMVYGKGVGLDATSSLILRDLLFLGNIIRYSPRRLDMYYLNWNDKPVAKIEDVESAYYIRFPCQDKPGVIGLIATILGKNKINIASAHAEVEKTYANSIGFVHILIDRAKEKQVLKSIRDVEALNITKGKVKLFRILKEV
ncbi:homoserine dehydrogenase [Caldithrix abyssi DSM 13497]|uniref:Homoserine dehydrogenase n=1 Tax=Caldithrix abyssi DSM 13497 TaxID=880073 RepID=H1XXW8_CALAY|nr:homoserine dehydrogenase [Caldithrix abyssi]APF20656.1 homoserine dehydrogenase [Caldithrix abyssi DSM 13497]EHO40843.1 homoserine dehydrogenase [Caldithrix abyssi DSM 13497]